MSRRFTYNPTTGCDERHVGKTRELFAQRRFGWADPPPGPSHDDDDDELTRKIAASPAGMASWAGTGPDGETCGRCRLFAPSSPLDGGCKQYVEIRKAQGKGKPKPIPLPGEHVRVPVLHAPLRRVADTMLERTPSRRRPSFGRTREERGDDLFDTPPIALAPLFAHEPLLQNVTVVCEPFCGIGNLVTAMRARGLTVHASDKNARGCPDSTVLDFAAMVERPAGCDVLVSNPPYSDAMGHLEHAWKIEFRVVAFLLPPSFLFTAKRFDRLHSTGHLRRVHTLAERLQGMHDAAHIARGGKKGSQNQTHAWFVFDRDYCGSATINPVSINRPDVRMPWAPATERPVTLSSKRYIMVCAGCGLLFEATRRDRLTCSGACRVRAHRSGAMEGLRACAKHFDVEVYRTLQARAVTMLCPELEPRIKDGSLTLDQVQEEVGRAFNQLVLQDAARVRSES